MKYIYRAVFLLLIFCGSVFFFSRNMKENVFGIETKAVELGDASLPTVFMRVEECDFNRLHGYSSNLDAMQIRETITPVMADKNLMVVIDENEYDIRKVTYDITDTVTGEEIDSGSVIALEKEGEYKTAKIKLKCELVSGREYAAKITLISNESKRVYYYTRIVLSDASHLAEKLQFVNEFHTASLDDEQVYTLEKYMETKSGSDTTDYSYVDIYSKPEMLSYGGLTPNIIYSELPVITEYAKDTATVTLSYYMSMNTSSGTEYYNVKECYRFRYTQTRVYLYDYKRYTETVFDYRMASTAKNEFKLGITGDKDIEAKASPDKKMTAFVRSGTLWLYDYSKSEIINVFSFRQKNTDYFRDTYTAHDIKIINVKNDGSVEFMVYGYMNRGDYEGRCGIIFYEYNPAEIRIKELLYIPVNAAYSYFNTFVGDFAYHTESGVLYFTAFEKLYSYNFVSEVLSIIAEDVRSETMYYCEALRYFAWQDKPEAAQKINILLLDTGEITEIAAKDGGYIRMFGSTDNYLIYGLVNADDVHSDDLGNKLYPAYEVQISDYMGNVMKNYSKEGYFVTGAQVEENVITLTRLKADENKYSGYADTETDCILKALSGAVPDFKVSVRATDLMLTEYYFSLPSGVTVTSIPKQAYAKNEVLLKDTTLRLAGIENLKDMYYAYSFGENVYCGRNAGEAIAAADAGVGTVTDCTGMIIWQRGVKSTKSEIEGITPVYNSDNAGSVAACMRMLCLYKNIDAGFTNDMRKQESTAAMLSRYTKAKVLDMTGAELDAVLYMVSCKKPVLAMMGDDRAVLIYSYDQTGINVIDPYARKSVRIPVKEAAQVFEMYGNRFISYYDGF